MSADKDILTKGIESWAGFAYTLRKENRVLFEEMLGRCKKTENLDCAAAMGESFSTSRRYVMCKPYRESDALSLAQQAQHQKIYSLRRNNKRHIATETIMRKSVLCCDHIPDWLVGLLPIYFDNINYIAIVTIVSLT
jgi:hypothetical protein